MQFEFDADLAEVRELTAEIFADLASVDRVREVEQQHGGFDDRLWATLAETGVLGLAVPDEHGGAGLGLLGLVAALEQQGRRVAPVPLAEVVATGILPLTRFGAEAQREKWLSGLLDGSQLVVGGFGRALDARADGSGWIVTGSAPAVAGAPVAVAVLVAVTTDDGVRVAIVPTDRGGVTVTPVSVTGQGSAGTVSLEAVRIEAADLLAGGQEIVTAALTWARIASAAVLTGVCEEAVRMTAAYTSERVQFGRPLSTNQAVTTRAADAHLDAERLRLTTRRAAWLVDRDDPESSAAALVAAWWAARGGLRAVIATQHLHGGMGADIDYPIHRYFLWGRQISFSLGGAAAIQAELGDQLDTITPIGAPA